MSSGAHCFFFLNSDNSIEIEKYAWICSTWGFTFHMVEHLFVAKKSESFECVSLQEMQRVLAAGDVNQRTKDSWLTSLFFASLQLTEFKCIFKCPSQRLLLPWWRACSQHFKKDKNWVQFHNTDACLFIAVFSIAVTSFHPIFGNCSVCLTWWKAKLSISVFF